MKLSYVLIMVLLVAAVICAVLALVSVTSIYIGANKFCKNNGFEGEKLGYCYNIVDEKINYGPGIEYVDGLIAKYYFT